MEDSILREVASWVLINKEYKDLSLNNFMMYWITVITMNSMRTTSMPLKWIPPQEGFLKLILMVHLKETPV